LPLLAAHFVKKHARRIGKEMTGVDDQAMAMLIAHRWPGNVRELENVIERAVVMSDGPEIGIDLIQIGRRRTQATRLPSLNLHQNIEGIERETVRCALEMSPVKRQAARALGISPRALAHYLAKYPALRQAASNPQPAGKSGVQPDAQYTADTSSCEITL